MLTRLGVVIAIIGFAMSASPVRAITVPITETPIAPTVGSIQEAVAGLANGVAQIVTSIETAVGRITSAIADRLAGVDPSSNALSYTAIAATTVASNPAAAIAADEPVASSPEAPAPPPPSATPATALSVPSGSADSVSPINVFAVQSALGVLAARVQGLASLLSAQTGASPSANVESQLAALQREIAQTNQINNLSNVTLSSPTIVSPSIAGLTTTQVSEGSNLYFTNERVASYIESSSTWGASRLAETSGCGN
jgi:hypothetical protein